MNTTENLISYSNEKYPWEALKLRPLVFHAFALQNQLTRCLWEIKAKSQTLFTKFGNKNLLLVTLLVGNAVICDKEI